MKKGFLKEFLLLIMLFSILLGGAHAQPQLSRDQEASWATLFTGEKPVAVGIMQLDGEHGQDFLVVVNTAPSSKALSSFKDEITKLQTRDLTNKEYQELETLKEKLKNYGTVSAFFGLKDGRFWKGAETLLYKEVVVNKPRPEGMLRVEEKLPSVEPAAIVMANRDGCGLLIASRRSPYIFNISGSKLENVSLVNEKNLKKSERLEALKFPEGTSSMAIEDFDGDRKVDLVLANPKTKTVSIYKGQGECSFDINPDTPEVEKWREWKGTGRVTPELTEEERISAERLGKLGLEPNFVAVADLNNDEAPDLVVANSGEGSYYLDPATGETKRYQEVTIHVILGHGDGNFELPKAYEATHQPRFIIIKDFNKDGHLDLIVAGVRDFAFLSGNGDGTFNDARRFGSLANELELPAKMIAEDFNLDGNLDLAVTNIGAGSIDIYSGKGDGTFQPPKSYSLGEGSVPVDLVATDLDWGDNDLDLIVVTQGKNEIIVLLNKGDGSFRKLPHPHFGFGASSITVGDFNGDGSSDLAVTHLKTNRVDKVSSEYPSEKKPFEKMRLLKYLKIDYEKLNTGDITFMYGGNAEEGITPPLTDIDEEGWGTEAPKKADDSFQIIKLKYDKKKDKYSADISAGTAPPSETVKTVGIYPSSAAAGNLDRDKKDDLIVVNFVTNNLDLFLSSASLHEPFLPFTTRSRAVVVGDFNNDGNLDLAVANYGTQSIYIMLSKVELEEETGKVKKINFSRERWHWCPVGKQPIAMAVEDFDKDGNLDLAVVNSGSDNVTILRGNGDGTCTHLGTARVGNKPFSITTADFDGRNGPDLAVANFSSDDVSILLNKGDGTFEDEQRTPIGIDDDGDGKVDEDPTDRIDNDGDGKIDEDPPQEGPISIVVGYKEGRSLDWLLGEDEDGIPDLAIANFVSNDVTILKGKGDGTFEARRISPDLPIHNAMKKQKIYYCYSEKKDKIEIWELKEIKVEVKGEERKTLGCKDGTVGENEKLLKSEDITIANGPIGIAVSDFDGDGSLDLAVAVEFPAHHLKESVEPDWKESGDEHAAIDIYEKLKDVWQDVFIYYSRGEVRISPREAEKPPLEGDKPVAVATGYFDDDEVPDVAMINQGSNKVSIHLGIVKDGEILFTPKEAREAPQGRLLEVGDSPSAIARGDFDGNGIPDLAVTNTGSNTASVLLGNPDGTFRDGGEEDVGGVNPRAVVVGDFDGKGFLDDLAIANSGSNNVAALCGKGDGTFLDPKTFRVQTSPMAITSGDFDGDGIPDLATANYTSNSISILLGGGDCAFEVKEEAVAGYKGEGPASIITEDFNKDGCLDLAAVNFTSNDVTVLLGECDGTFSSPRRVPIEGQRPRAIISGDFDRDGILDLAIPNYDSGNVSILLGDGRGNFSPEGTIPVGDGPRAIAIEDFNRDGILDLVIACELSNNTWILRGRGDGTFEAVTVTTD